MPLPSPLRLKAFVRLAIAAALAAASTAFAAGRVGDFDFYVLALTWSPAYCAGDDPDPSECDIGGRGFVVHGLWPQYEGENGGPTECDSSEPAWVDRAVLDRYADIYPGRGFAAYQWREHGRCSGLSADRFFGLVREAVSRVEVPAAYRTPSRVQKVAPSAVETAFVAANPGLARDGMAVRCTAGRLSEIRICFSKDLEFRPCPAVDAAACRSGSVTLLPLD